MPFDLRQIAALALVALPLAGCMAGSGSVVSASDNFGEANRQTMLAQVIDPLPDYETPLETSAEHAAQAVERYRKGQVKRPERITTSTAGSSNGSGGGGGQ